MTVILCTAPRETQTYEPVDERSARTGSPAPSGGRRRLRLLSFHMWCFVMYSDGISYLDIADRYRKRGVARGGESILEPSLQLGARSRHASAYWARLAGVEIIAEVPTEYDRVGLTGRLRYGHSQTDAFWRADPSGQQLILDAFARTGAAGAGQRAGSTETYARPLHREPG